MKNSPTMPNHADIITRHNAGESISIIAKSFGLSRRTIGRIISPAIRVSDKEKARAAKWYYDREKRAVIDKRYREKRRKNIT